MSFQVGNHVTVFDGSWSFCINQGRVAHCDGLQLKEHTFVVLAVGGSYPSLSRGDQVNTNNIMLQDVCDTEFILFSESRFCNPAPDKVVHQEILVSSETTELTIKFVRVNHNP